VDKTDAIYGAECNGKGTCDVSLCVYGFVESTYNIQFNTLGGSTPTTIPTLEYGVALRDDYDPAQGPYSYYTFPINSSTPVTVTLTPLGDTDPDMYIRVCDSANNCPVPTNSSSTYHSSGLGHEVVDIPSRTAAGVAIVGVQGYRGSLASYTLLVTKQSQPTRLVDGQSQFGIVGEHQTDHYLLDVPVESHHDGVQASISPVWGDPDVYIALGVSRTASRSSYDYSMIGTGGVENIVMSTMDESWIEHCPEVTSDTDGQFCRFNVAVYGFDAAGYFLTLTSGYAVLILTDGVPVPGSVLPGKYKYYMFEVSEPGYAISFDLSPASGDPDMFVSCINPHPTVFNHTWSSMNIGEDTILIDPDHACPSPARYYVGVRGFNTGFNVTQPATYTLTAHSRRPNASTVLLPGQPQNGHALPAQFTYYTFNAADLKAAGQSVEFEVTELSGHVELYVNNQADAAGKPIFPTLDCPIPGAQCVVNNYGWSSIRSATRHTVNIAAADMGSGLFNIGVLETTATGVGSDYSIVASGSQGTTTLQPGIPQEGSVTHAQYDYYRVVIGTTNDITVTLTTFSGDADLYASESVHPDTNARWRSQSMGDEDRLLVRYSDLSESCHSNVTAGRTCSLYVSAYGFGPDANSYTIVASFEGSETGAIYLGDGIPQSAIVHHGAYQYFIADTNVRPGTTMTVTVTSGYGDADVYVNYGPSSEAVAFPTNTQYTRHSSMASGADRIIMAPTDADYCTHCVWKISVYGFADSIFTITYSTGGITDLQDGVPTDGFVSAGNYSYYRFYIPSANSDVQISLTPETGDADMYVSQENPGDPFDLPRRGHSTWMSVDIGDDTISIPHTDAHFCSDCSIIIGVYGFQAAEFELVVTTSNTELVELRLGEPQEAQATNGVPRYFRVYTGGSLAQITVELGAIEGQANMYATLEYSEGNSGTLPGPNRMDAGQGDSVTPLHISPTASNTAIVIGVYSASTETAIFSISASQAHGETVLLEGVTTPLTSIAQGENQLFRFDISELHADVTLTLTAVSGDADIVATMHYITPGCSFVTPQVTRCYNYTYLSRHTGSDSLTIPAADILAAPIPKVVHVAVFGFSAAEYLMLAQYANRRVDLEDGVEIRGRTSQQTVCAQRNAFTGECEGTDGRLKQVQWFTYVVPRGDNVPSNIAIQVKRMCPGGNPGACGPNLGVYGNSCAETSCTMSQKFPDDQHNMFSQNIADVSGTLTLNPYNSGGCNLQQDGCAFYFAVMPSCTVLGCHQPTNFTITLSTGESEEAIDDYCFRPGSECQLSVRQNANHQTNSFTAMLPVRPSNQVFTLESCLSNAIMYGCDASSACTGPPGPNTGAWRIETTSSTGVAIHQGTALTGRLFLNVQGTTDFPYYSYRLGVRNAASAFFTLTNYALQLGDADDSQVTVRWNAGSIDNGGSTTAASGVQYTVYAVKIEKGSQVEAHVHLDTPCGLEYLAANLGTDVVTRSVTDLTFMTLELPSQFAGSSYQINVVATCGAGCLPNGDAVEQVAFTPLEYKHSGGEGKKKKKHGNGGKDAGIAIGVIFGLGVLGAGGFFGFRAFKQWRDGRAMSNYYAAALDGGDGGDGYAQF
jgi:hypothetical protein